jgi:hypothetical protein
VRHLANVRIRDKDVGMAARSERGIKARARIVENFAMLQAIQRYVELYTSLEPGRG